MAIRRACPHDADAIAVLFRRSYGGLTFLPTLHTPEQDREFFRRVVRDDEVWVADVGGRIAGFAALGDAMLNHLYVDPEHQGAGIGTALLAQAKDRRPGGFRLWTFQQNEGARRFYERHGCRAIEFTDGSGNEETQPDVLYEWCPLAGRVLDSGTESAHASAPGPGSVDHEGKG
jgi:GNAT superfamily N-acetyltransferase